MQKRALREKEIELAMWKEKKGRENLINLPEEREADLSLLCSQEAASSMQKYH